MNSSDSSDFSETDTGKDNDHHIPCLPPPRKVQELDCSKDTMQRMSILPNFNPEKYKQYEQHLHGMNSEEAIGQTVSHRSLPSLSPSLMIYDNSQCSHSSLTRNVLEKDSDQTIFSRTYERYTDVPYCIPQHSKMQYSNLERRSFELTNLHQLQNQSILFPEANSTHCDSRSSQIHEQMMEERITKQCQMLENGGSLFCVSPRSFLMGRGRSFS